MIINLIIFIQCYFYVTQSTNYTFLIWSDSSLTKSFTDLRTTSVAINRGQCRDTATDRCVWVYHCTPDIHCNRSVFLVNETLLPPSTYNQNGVSCSCQTEYILYSITGSTDLRTWDIPTRKNISRDYTYVPVIPTWNPHPFEFGDVSNRKRFLDQANQTASVKFDSPVLSIQSSDLPNTFVVISILQQVFTTRCTTPCLYSLPTQALIRDAIMSVKIFISDVLIDETTFNIVAGDACTIVDCKFICIEYFTHFICYSAFAQFMIILSFIFMISSTVFLIVWLLKISIICFRKMCPTYNYDLALPGSRDRQIELSPMTMVIMCCCLASPVSASNSFLDSSSLADVALNINCWFPLLFAQKAIFTILNCILNISYGFYFLNAIAVIFSFVLISALKDVFLTEKVVKTTKFETHSDDSSETTSYHLENPLNSKFIKLIDMRVDWKLVLVCITILFLVPGVNSQCTSTTVQQSALSSCMTSGTTTTCNLQLNVLASLSTIGSKVCGTVISNDNSLLGTFNITYLGSRTTVSLIPMYFTSDWNPLAGSHKSCQNDNWCGLGSGCNNNWIVSGLLAGPVTLWPGVKSCEASCGCAGCGCFFCGDACIFSKYAFEPTGSVYQVLRIVSQSVQPSIKIDFELGGVRRTSTIALNDRPAILFTNYSLSLIGSFSGPTTLFGTNKVIIGNNQVRLAPANEVGDPQFGAAGDIQTASPGSLFVPSETAFIFPSTTVPHTSQQNGVTYQFPSPGYNTFISAPTLPLQIGQSLWSYDGTSLVSADLNPPAIQITFSTISPVTFSYLVTAICPFITGTTTSSGCYNCQSGFAINIRARSNCDIGSVQVYLTTNNRLTLFTQSIQLSKTDQNYILSASSLDKNMQGSVCLQGTGSNLVCLPFAGVLSDPPPLSQQQINDIVSNATVFPSTNSLSDLWNSMTGSAAIVKYVIIILVALAAIASIGAMAYGTYRAVEAYKDYKTKNPSYSNMDENVDTIDSDQDDMSF